MSKVDLMNSIMWALSGYGLWSLFPNYFFLPALATILLLMYLAIEEEHEG